MSQPSSEHPTFGNWRGLCPFCQHVTVEHDSAFCELEGCRACRGEGSCGATECGQMPRSQPSSEHEQRVSDEQLAGWIADAEIAPVAVQGMLGGGRSFDLVYDLRDCRAALAESQQQHDALRLGFADFVLTTEERIKNAVGERDALQERLDALPYETEEELATALRALQQQHDALRAELDTIEDEAPTLRAELAASKRETIVAEQALASLRAEHEKLRHKWQAMADQSRERMAALRRQVGEWARQAKAIADRCAVKPQHGREPGSMIGATRNELESLMLGASKLSAAMEREAASGEPTPPQGGQPE